MLLLLVACNLIPKPDTGPDSGDDGLLSIKDIRGGAAADGEVVTIIGAVVTSPITRDGEGFFIQDEDGGPRSGLYVWFEGGVDPYLVDEGDKVMITGTISEYYGWTELSVSSPANVEELGTAAVPAPVELGDGKDVNWDDYESVLVSLSNQEVTSVDSYNTAALTCGINLDDGFIFLDHACTTSYTSLTGIIFYTYEAFSINPRNEADLGDSASGGSSAATVAELQQGDACGSVTLTDVVVTSPVDDDGDLFFVQDAGGGPYSGVAVFMDGQGADVEVGDVITVTGSVTEYYDFTEFVVAAPTDISVTTSATPTSLELSAPPDDWEPYEGALITLLNVSATAEPDAYGQISTDWGLLIDDLYHFEDATSSSTWASVTGVLSYSYAEWKLLPRSSVDYVF